MTDDTKIRAAWEAYHGPIPGIEDYIPDPPPAYVRGYQDGVESVAGEICAVCNKLTSHQAHWSDETMIRSCLIRLRALLSETKKNDK